MDLSNDRNTELNKWLAAELGHTQYTIEPASEDASFRRYFRVNVDQKSYIVMDAPPEYENCETFVHFANLLEQYQLNVPHIYKENMQQGFLLLSDLGNTPYLSQLNPGTANELYHDALNALYIMQTRVPHAQLPEYSAKLLQFEMSLFTDWFLETHLHHQLDSKAKNIIADTFDKLTTSALEQPRFFVHRDYHSRNLMITAQNNPGILDFQDAVQGPVTYDLVSLLKDCYIAWPKTQVRDWTGQYYHRLQNRVLQNVSPAQFERWFDWMGMQRHLKAIGIFARLNHRDHKADYLGDIPRTLKYVLDVCRQYVEFSEFEKLLQQLRVIELIEE